VGEEVVANEDLAVRPRHPNKHLVRTPRGGFAGHRYSMLNPVALTSFAVTAAIASGGSGTANLSFTLRPDLR